MVAGLAGWSVFVVLDGVVDVDVAADAGGVGEDLADGAQVDAFLDGLGVFVGVDPGPVVEVDDGLEVDVGVAQEPGDLVEEQGAEVLDPGDAVALEGGFVEVDVDHGPGPPTPGRLLRRLVGSGWVEEVQDAVGVGEPAEGFGAELVAGGVGGEVGDQIAARVEGVGDAVDEVVDPDRGSGLEVSDDVA